MERMDDITKILAQQTELLNSLQNEIIDIKKTLNKNSQTDCDTDTIGQTSEEDEEDNDFTFSTPDGGDEFYCIWISDSRTSYKNPVTVCNDFVDVTMFNDADFYDIAHNISIFENRDDAEQYANHINIDMTIYRLKCYYNDHFPHSESDDVIYLGYDEDLDDGSVNIYHKENPIYFSDSVTILSSMVSAEMLVWMEPILEKYFGFTVVG